MLEAESIYPPGHFKNPLDRSGVEEKFLRITSGLVDPEESKKFFEEAWMLEKLVDPARPIRRLLVRG